MKKQPKVRKTLYITKQAMMVLQRKAAEEKRTFTNFVSLLVENEAERLLKEGKGV